jgi:heme-degrading monooxygenase HmoA
MYARMTVAQVQPERFDEAVTTVQDAFLPAAKEQPGYRGFLLLTERGQQQLVGISLWESEADVQFTGGTSGYYQQRMAAFAELLVAPPTTTIHEVAVWEP